MSDLNNSKVVEGFPGKYNKPSFTFLPDVIVQFSNIAAIILVAGLGYALVMKLKKR